MKTNTINASSKAKKVSSIQKKVNIKQEKQNIQEEFSQEYWK